MLYTACMPKARIAKSPLTRCRAGDVSRIRMLAAKRLISQTDLIHVMINVWEGLSEHDQQIAVSAAGEQRAIQYQMASEQTRTLVPEGT